MQPDKLRSECQQKKLDKQQLERQHLPRILSPPQIEVLKALDEYDINNKSYDELEADYNRFDVLYREIRNILEGIWERKEDCIFTKADDENEDVLLSVSIRMGNKTLKMLRRKNELRFGKNLLS